MALKKSCSYMNLCYFFKKCRQAEKTNSRPSDTLLHQPKVHLLYTLGVLCWLYKVLMIRKKVTRG